MNADFSGLACWVISLNSETPNSTRLLNALRQQGLNAGFFSAVDGRQAMPLLEGGERFCHNLALVRHGRQMTGGEVGCYLSHLRAVKMAYREGYQHLCIIEDDVVIEPLFGEVVRSLLDKNLDMVRLMSLKVRRRKVLTTLAGEHQLVRPERGGLGTQAYLLSRAGMEKFIQHANTIYEPIDKVFDHFWLFDLKVYAVEPHVAYELLQETSVAKSLALGQAKLGVHYRVAQPFVKLYFSLRRHLYLNLHRAEFYPAAMPEASPGKSQRQRWKKR
ncbi:glycosyltransferase family 25 protein [Spongiibacter sp. IMCC21906]|uniref:glycosyltransferase family 25 protein n=1 Tax=Spongiibacter sp. IMCC21906 TaxID=1620392 RepID=UPI001E3ABFBD|nr:glycosyltransferase family 25 protein [Spongiibacter sp. IMCC21906]